MEKKRKKATEKEKTTLRLPPTVLRQMKHMAIDRGVNLQQAVAEGAELWMAGGRLVAEEELDSADRALAAALPRMLKEAHPSVANVVRAMIREWLGSVEIRKSRA